MSSMFLHSNTEALWRRWTQEGDVLDPTALTNPSVFYEEVYLTSTKNIPPQSISRPPSNGNVITLSAIRQCRRRERWRRYISTDHIHSFVFCTDRFVTKCFFKGSTGLTRNTLKRSEHGYFFCWSHLWRDLYIFYGGMLHPTGSKDISDFSSYLMTAMIYKGTFWWWFSVQVLFYINAEKYYWIGPDWVNMPKNSASYYCLCITVEPFMRQEEHCLC